MKVTILGCGPSNGVPSLTRGFGECDPENPKNVRTRTAALITTNDGKNILIDTDPEIRMQLLRAGSPKIDAVLYTHSHYDHMGGANDLCSLVDGLNSPLPIYLTKESAAQFEKQLDYIVNTEHNLFDIRIIEPYQPFSVGQTLVMPILQYHGNQISLGYRIGDFAYSTDLKKMDKKGFELLKGIKVWVLGVVSPIKNPKYLRLPKHIYLDEALEWIENVQPERVYLTHMGQRMDYDALCERLPEFIRPGYDNLVIEF